MWFVYDVFTGERFGPYASEIDALLDPELGDRSITTRYVRGRRRKG